MVLIRLAGLCGLWKACSWKAHIIKAGVEQPSQVNFLLHRAVISTAYFQFAKVHYAVSFALLLGRIVPIEMTFHIQK